MITFDLKFGVGSGSLNFSDEYKTLITEACTILIDIINTSTYKTWLNLNYWDRRINQNKVNPILTKIEIAKNILHEYCHNLGFGHKGNKRNRYYNIHSVPYALITEFNKIAIEKYRDDKALTKMSELDFENEHIVECSFCANNDIA